MHTTVPPGLSMFRMMLTEFQLKTFKGFTTLENKHVQNVDDIEKLHRKMPEKKKHACMHFHNLKQFLCTFAQFVQMV